MTRTVAWSPRVGEVWVRDGHPDVEVVAEHTQAGLVKLSNSGGETEWVPVVDLEADYVQACCGECGMPLTVMRKMLIDARREPAPAPKSKPGTYCTQSCCWPPHAPPTC